MSIAVFMELFLAMSTVVEALHFVSSKKAAKLFMNIVNHKYYVT